MAVTGCTTLQQSYQAVQTTVQQAVTPDNFDTVTSLYGSTLAIAVSYRRLCAAKVIHKSCWNVIEKLQPYEAKTYAAYSELRRFVRSNPTVDASNLIRITRDTIIAFRDAQIANGVK